MFWGINDFNLFEKDGIQYVLDLYTEKAVVSKYVENDSYIKILSNFTFNDVKYSVTSINIGAFDGCNNLKSIFIPENVKNICSELFNAGIIIYYEGSSKPSSWYYDWDGDEIYGQIYLGVNVSNFYEEDGIQYVLNLETKTANVCRYVGNNSEVKIKDIIIINVKEYTVDSIGVCAFYNCTSLINVETSKNITKIKAYAFEKCNNLRYIVIPESLIYIGQEVFFDCNSLHIYCEVNSKPSGWAYSWNRSRFAMKYTQVGDIFIIINAILSDESVDLLDAQIMRTLLNCIKAIDKHTVEFQFNCNLNIIEKL